MTTTATTTTPLTVEVPLETLVTLTDYAVCGGWEEGDVIHRALIYAVAQEPDATATAVAETRDDDLADALAAARQTVADMHQRASSRAAHELGQ